MKKLLTVLFSLLLAAVLLPFALHTASADGETSGQCGEDLYWSFDEESGTLTITGEGEMEEYYDGRWDDEGYFIPGDPAPWFSYAQDIKHLSLPSGLTNISSLAFRDCSELTSVTIPDSVTRIGAEAFSCCCGLTSVTIPDSVTEIGGSAFSGCTGLAKITIPDSVTEIGRSAFYGCTGLAEITIPDSVTSIGYAAFSDCTSLTKITIPDSVTEIGDGAFSFCSKLTSITIPDSITSIGEIAFAYCSKLTSITIPGSVTSIGAGAFSCCSKLTSITIPDSVTSIRDYTFYNCEGLTSISIPDSVTEIGNGAFECCTGLKTVIIGNSITTIGWHVFSGCTNLETVYYAGSPEQKEAIEIDGNDELLSATWHYIPIIKAVSGDKSVLIDKTVKLKVTAKSAQGETLKYQWYYRTSSKGSWKKVSGTAGKKALYTFKATAKKNGYQYRCKVTGADGSVYTKIIKLKTATIFGSSAKKVTFTIKTGSKWLQSDKITIKQTKGVCEYMGLFGNTITKQAYDSYTIKIKKVGGKTTTKKMTGSSCTIRLKKNATYKITVIPGSEKTLCKKFKTTLFYDWKTYPTWSIVSMKGIISCK